MSPDAAVVGACPYPAIPAPVSVRLVTLPEHDCPYLPGRVATNRAFCASRLSGELYHDFMDAGFRRSGKLVYQPVCRGCRACLPIRLPVDRFIPSKSQRRCWKRNQDLRVDIGPPRATDEKFTLYHRYMRSWHASPSSHSRDEFEEFLYDSPVDSIEMTYRDAADKLLAVGICDVCERSLSSVYFYHDPDAFRRGLGTFGVLCEIELARRRKISHYYLGYWVRGCGSMQYKADFRPHEILYPDNVWRAATG